MKIIRKGKQKKDEFTFVCSECDCKFIAEDSDRQIDTRDGDYVICPCCHSWIDWTLHK